MLQLAGWLLHDAWHLCFEAFCAFKCGVDCVEIEPHRSGAHYTTTLMPTNLTACTWIVGLLWGVTNPLVKRGSIAAEARASSGGKFSSLASHVTTPSFLLPQVINSDRTCVPPGGSIADPMQAMETRHASMQADPMHARTQALPPPTALPQCGGA